MAHSDYSLKTTGNGFITEIQTKQSGFFCFLIYVIQILYRKKCKRRSGRKRGDPEAGLVTSSFGDRVRKEHEKEKNMFEKNAARKKRKASERSPQSPPGKSNATPQDIQSTNNATDAPTSRTLNKETLVDIPSTPICTATGTPGTEVRINMEASDSTLPESLSSTSVRSQPSIHTPNETPQSTPPKSCFAEPLSTLPKSFVSESDISTGSKEPKLPPSTSPAETVNNLTPKVETGSTPVQATLANEVPISTPADSYSIPKESAEQTNPVALETGDTSSSTESCKTPVAPGNDVTITVEDDDESKSPSLISENESPSAQVIYTRKESATETTLNMDVKNGTNDEVNTDNAAGGTRCDKDDMALKVPTDEGKPFVTSYFDVPLSLFCLFL